MGLKAACAWTRVMRSRISMRLHKWQAKKRAGGSIRWCSALQACTTGSSGQRTGAAQSPQPRLAELPGGTKAGTASSRPAASMGCMSSWLALLLSGYVRLGR